MLEGARTGAGTGVGGGGGVGSGGGDCCGRIIGTEILGG